MRFAGSDCFLRADTCTDRTSSSKRSYPSRHWVVALLSFERLPNACIAPLYKKPQLVATLSQRTVLRLRVTRPAAWANADRTWSNITFCLRGTLGNISWQLAHQAHVPSPASFQKQLHTSIAAVHERWRTDA